MTCLMTFRITSVMTFPWRAVVVSAGSCRALLGWTGEGARPHTGLDGCGYSSGSSASFTTSTTRLRMLKTNFCLSPGWKVTRMGVRSQSGGGHSESGSSARGGFAYFFFQDGLAASYLGHYRVEFLAVFGDAAVGDVVAIPARRRIEGIELGQVELGDSSGEAVDQQPAAALPLPARGAGILGGQRIVHAKSAPDHKQAVGQLMRSFRWCIP